MGIETPTSEPGAVGGGSASPSGSAEPSPTLDWQALDDARKINFVYQLKCKDAEAALPQVLPRVWEYCEKHRAAGRTWLPCYPYKLLELWAILQQEKPKQILELGTGCTTAVMSEYAYYNGADLTTVDESREWQEAVYKDFAASGMRHTEACFQSSGVKWIGSSAVCYHPMPPIYSCDFLYIDGPSNNKNSHEAICLEAGQACKCEHLKTMVFDIRRRSVEYTQHFNPPFNWQLSAWQESGVPWYLSGFRHHTVARRRT